MTFRYYWTKLLTCSKVTCTPLTCLQKLHIVTVVYKLNIVERQLVLYFSVSVCIYMYIYIKLCTSGSSICI